MLDFKIRERKEQRREKEEKKPDDFLGNSSISKVVGIYKQSDIITGISRSGKKHSKNLGLEYGQRSKRVGGFSSGSATKSRGISGLVSNKRIKF